LQPAVKSARPIQSARIGSLSAFAFMTYTLYRISDGAWVITVACDA
jgi:hypothetical protein